VHNDGSVVVYWLPMKYSRAVRSLAGALLLTALTQGRGLAFQARLFDGLADRLGNSEAEPRTSAAVSESNSFHPAHLRVDTSLAVIPVHVTTAFGKPVTDLTKDSFRLFESNGGDSRVEQRITYFGAEDTPVSIGLLLDTSGSMRSKMHEAAEAAQAFFKTANVEDEFFLVEFAERAKLAVGFTPDSEELQRRIAHTRTMGRTSLLDAIHVAMVEMKRARHSRKALVILSDGGDNHSRYTTAEIRRAVAESEVEIYAMGIFDPGIDRDDARKLSSEERNGPRLLDELADSTGGRHFPVERLADLAEIAERIGNQLRSQYVLGYSPQAARDGKYHRVIVELATPAEWAPPGQFAPLRVNYRRGFYGLGD
jgi:Ca-activated chloride channel family protein